MERATNSKKNILVVDPDPEFCRNVRLYLEENYTVFSRQGLEYLDYTIILKKINLLLIDAENNSPYLAQELSDIRRKHSDVRLIIMYTYFSTSKEEEMKLANVADQMLAKPFDVQILKEKVDILLESAFQNA